MEVEHLLGLSILVWCILIQVAIVIWKRRIKLDRAIMSVRPLVVALDFDGVVCEIPKVYNIEDLKFSPPIKGSIEFINSLLEDRRFEVVVYSCRLNYSGGYPYILKWLEYWGVKIGHRSRGTNSLKNARYAVKARRIKKMRKQHRMNGSKRATHCG